MEKNPLSDADILDRIEKGFRLYKKKVKKYTYLVARRGQRMISLGPYSDEKWHRYLRIEHNFESEKSSRGHDRTDNKELDEISRKSTVRFRNITEDYLRDLEQARGYKKWAKCVHLENLYCTHWRWDLQREKTLLYDIKELNAFIDAPEDTGIIMIEDEGTEKFILKANQIYCSTCTAYAERSA